VRTGVTAIVPHADRAAPCEVRAAIHALNGNGEMTGSHWIDHHGAFLGPVLITDTHAVGACHEAAVRWMVGRWPSLFLDDHGWAMPVVAETYDGFTNDILGLHVRPEHGLAATDAPLSGLQLRRLAQRGALGIGRLGGIGGNWSGDIVLAMSVADPVPALGLGLAARSLSTVKPRGTLHAIDADSVAARFAQRG
jgi:L-aminopeptidase/D-esterase-like protein